MKILFAVFTCNRLHYLKNCVKSIQKFVDLSQDFLMVVDNCSMEKGTDEYISSLDSNIIIQRFKDRVPNELYRAMNYTIKYCIKNNIDIVNFIQDDYQFLYSLDSMIPTVKLCFKKHKKVGQINYNLAWKRKRVENWPTINVSGTNFSILNTKNLVDNGFTRVSVYKKTGLYPRKSVSYDQNSEKSYGFDKNRYKKISNGELWFGSRCRKLGYVRAFSLLPNQGMMFDCAYIRKNLRFGNYFPPPEEFYLKPFNKSEINKIARRNRKKRISFIEEMVTPWGWEPTTYDKHNRQKIKKSILES